jgi:hypothetical protein
VLDKTAVAEDSIPGAAGDAMTTQDVSFETPVGPPLLKTRSANRLRISLSLSSQGVDQLNMAPAKVGGKDAGSDRLEAAGPVIPASKQAAVTEFKERTGDGHGLMLC